MPIGDICTRDVVTANKSTTIREAAALMRRNHVGDLVVTEEDVGPGGLPYTVGDLVARELVTARENEGIFETVQRMRMNGVRRMPVIDGHGALVGVVSVDDLIQLLAEEMGALAKLISRGQVREAWIKA